MSRGLLRNSNIWWPDERGVMAWIVAMGTPDVHHVATLSLGERGLARLVGHHGPMFRDTGVSHHCHPSIRRLGHARLNVGSWARSVG